MGKKPADQAIEKISKHAEELKQKFLELIDSLDKELFLNLNIRKLDLSELELETDSKRSTKKIKDILIDIEKHFKVRKIEAHWHAVNSELFRLLSEKRKINSETTTWLLELRKKRDKAIAKIDQELVMEEKEIESKVIASLELLKKEINYVINNYTKKLIQLKEEDIELEKVELEEINDTMSKLEELYTQMINYFN